MRVLLPLMTACTFSPGVLQDAGGGFDAPADAHVDSTPIVPGPFWTNIVAATADANSLTSAGPLGWNNSGAITRRVLTGDGYVEFSTAEADLGKAFGLSSQDENQSYTDIEFAFNLRATGAIHIYERGVERGTFGSYAAGDLFRIEIFGNLVTYWHNGKLLYTSAVAPTPPLFGDAAFYHPVATITAVLLNP